MSADPRRLAVLVSGTGRHLDNLARLVRAGELDATIGLVLCDRAGARALGRAEEAGLPHLLLDPERGLDPASFSRAAFEAIASAGCGTVVLAGFLRRLVLPPGWERRILNIHPSLLPAFGGQGFYGDRVHRAVLERGCKVSGCTVHYVDEEYDHGPILAQRVVPVLPGDDPHSLAARVFEAELEAYPEALREHLATARPSS